MYTWYDPVRDVGPSQQASDSGQVQVSQATTASDTVTSGTEIAASDLFYRSIGGCPPVPISCRPPQGFCLTVTDPMDMTSWTIKTPWSLAPQRLATGQTVHRDHATPDLDEACQKLDTQVLVDCRRPYLGCNVSKVMVRLAHGMLSSNPSHQEWQRVRLTWGYTLKRGYNKRKMLNAFLGVDTEPCAEPVEQFRYENIPKQYRISERDLSDAATFWMNCLAADPHVPWITFRQSYDFAHGALSLAGSSA